MGNRVHRDARSFSRYSFPKVGYGWSWKTTMGSYTDKIGQRFGLIGSVPVYTPLDPGFVIMEEDIPEQPD